MRPWILIVGLVMSFLLGGAAFAMADYGCNRGEVQVKVVHAEPPMSAHHSSGKTALPEDRCATAGFCRMAMCMAYLDVLAPPGPLHHAVEALVFAAAVPIMLGLAVRTASRSSPSIPVLRSRPHRGHTSPDKEIS